MNFYEEAEKKLRAALPGVKGSREGAIKGAVLEALLNFAKQEPEFAQAIAQGGSFADCMQAVCKGVTTSISDLEAYRRAAAFYFPGADVRFEMHIDLAGAAGAGERDEKSAESGRGGLIIDLADFL